MLIKALIKHLNHILFDLHLRYVRSIIVEAVGRRSSEELIAL